MQRNDSVLDATNVFFDARDRLGTLPKGIDKVAQSVKHFLSEDLLNWADDEVSTSLALDLQ